MKSLLILPHIKVEGANAISGLIYGFPAVTHFLGYIHSISRELEQDPRLRVKLGGCGIVCHGHQVHSYKIGPGGEHMFSLTRNPLTKDGNTSPFNEEGKMNMEISLIVECDFTVDDFNFHTGDIALEKQKFLELIYHKAIEKRLAGGIITEMLPIEFHELSQYEEKSQKEIRRILFKMLPGFILCDRSDVIEQYLIENPSTSSLDALLHFYTLKSKATLDPETKRTKWNYLPQPSKGWMVPLQAGYKAISPVYEKGEVTCTRDPSTPFCFVEPCYSLAEWVGPHRIHNINTILWNYQNDKEHYLCLNNINRIIKE